jgi:hypothetical protein
MNIPFCLFLFSFFSSSAAPSIVVDSSIHGIYIRRSSGRDAWVERSRGVKRILSSDINVQTIFKPSSKL